MKSSEISFSAVCLAIVALLMVVGIPLLVFFPEHSGEWKAGGGLLTVALAFCVGGFLNADAEMARARRQYESRRHY